MPATEKIAKTAVLSHIFVTEHAALNQAAQRSQEGGGIVARGLTIPYLQDDVLQKPQWN